MHNSRLALDLGTLSAPSTPDGLRLKLRAAARAGFAAVSVSLSDVECWRRSGRKLRDLQALIGDHGLSVAELGELPMCDDRGRVVDGTREFALAAALGAEVVTVLFKYPCDSIEVARDRWARFLEMVSDVENVRAALHFLGDASNFNTLDRLWDVVAEGPRNGVLQLDVYEFWRGQSSATSLDSIPTDLIGIVHLCDVRNVPRESATRADCTFPGEGVMPLTHIVSTLARRGYSGMFNVVVPPVSRRAGRLATARRAYSAARKVLSTSGPSHRKIACTRRAARRGA